MPMMLDFRNSAFGLFAIWGLVAGSGAFFREGYATRPGDAGDNGGRFTVIDQLLGIKRCKPGIPDFSCPLVGFDLPVGEESRR
jgi:hypothetical protein